MWSRVSFFFITVFWLAMMVLLGRSEFGDRKQLGSSVPIAVVWHKILNAPDPSSLEIRHGTNRIGFCRWSPNIRESISMDTFLDEEMPEGMITQPAEYTIDMDGNLTAEVFPNRLRFTAGLTFSTNHTWQDLQLRLNLRPDVYEIRADALQQKVLWRTDTGEGSAERTFTFADLRNPRKILAEVGGPLLPGLLGTMGLPTSTNQLSGLSLGLKWEARNSWLKVGHARMRAYQIQARLFDRYKIVVHVSMVGEILRVELPNKILLVSENLGPLQELRHD